jgi:hypothetical protein
MDYLFIHHGIILSLTLKLDEELLKDEEQEQL